jgi:predicted amidohydrolase
MTSVSYKAAAIQMNSQQDLDHNFEEAYQYIQKAAQDGALVVGLPENFAFLGGLTMRLKKADFIAKKVPRFLSQTAKEYNIYLMGGSYPSPAPNGKVFNHSVMYNPQGEEVCTYNKIHLFDVTLDEKEAYQESSYVQAGKPSPAVYSDDKIGGWGLSICYDIRFPEYYRKLVDKGADILSIPSAFTETTGKDHWKSLLKARAIENTSYVFAPAQTGLHGKNRRTWGHAMIIDPWGNVLADAGENPGLIYAEIDLRKVEEVRTKMPSLKHRKL